MKLTVLVITYNQANYIAQAIESALMQQTDFATEIVICDDCSTDGTRDVVLDFQGRYPDKVRLFLPAKNLGHSGGLIFKHALSTCRGDYIALLNGDDYWTACNKLQKQAAFLDKHSDCAICFHNITEIREDGRSGTWTYTPPGQKAVSDLEDLLPRNFINTSAVMFRKNACEDLPSSFYKIALVDWAVLTFAAHHGKIGYLNEIMSVYRIHSQGIWQRRSFRQMLEGEIEFYEYMRMYLDPQYKNTIETQLAKRRVLLQTEQTMERIDARLERLRRDATYQDLVTRIRDVVRMKLPKNANVIVVDDGDNELLQLNSRERWNVLHLQNSEQEELFAEGAQGAEEAPWIVLGKAYEFRLYAGFARKKLIARAMITHSCDILPSIIAPRDGQPHITAEPYPDAIPSKVEAVRVRWSTGDDTPGELYVRIDHGVFSYPETAGAAISGLEAERQRGAEFLLLPRTAFTWLGNFTELRDHLDREYQIIHEDEICRIYDLRGTTSETQLATTGTQTLESVIS